MDFPRALFKALSLALLFFSLPGCKTQQLNPFNVKVFLTSMGAMSEKMDDLKSSITANRDELLQRLAVFQNDTETNYVAVMEKAEILDSRANAIESDLQASLDTISNFERAIETASLKIEVVENEIEGCNVVIADLGTQVTGMSEQVSNLVFDKDEFQNLLENHKTEIDGNYAEAIEKAEMLDSRATIIESDLKVSQDAISNLETKLETASQKIDEIEATITASQNNQEELRTSVKAPRCYPPSIEIQGLGCVFFVETGMSWEHQRENCQYRGGRLLEGFNSEQFKELHKLFTGRAGYYWVGIKNQLWHSSAQPIVGLDRMWINKTDGCTLLAWSVPSVMLSADNCEVLAPSLCLADYVV